MKNIKIFIQQTRVPLDDKSDSFGVQLKCLGDAMSNLDNIGFVSVVITIAMLFMSYVTPYWSVYHQVGDRRTVNMGLLAYCEPTYCKWFLSDIQIQNELPGKRNVQKIRLSS